MNKPLIAAEKALLQLVSTGRTFSIKDILDELWGPHREEDLRAAIWTLINQEHLKVCWWKDYFGFL